MVNPVGPSSAKIMVVLDYPTDKEVNLKTAATGYVGYHLGEWFNKAGGPGTGGMYITHAIKDGIPTPKKVNFKNIPKFLGNIDHAKSWEYYEKILVEEVNSLEPNIIFACGEIAVQMLTRETSLYKYRGTLMIPSDKIGIQNGFTKILPIHSPRDIQKNYSAGHYTISDIRKGLKFQNDPNPYTDPSFTWVCRDGKSLQNYVDRIYKTEWVVTDIETHNTFITAIGFSHDGREGVSIPLLDRAVPTYEVAFIYKKLVEFLNDSKVKFVGHNFVFDCFWLRYWDLISFDRASPFKVEACTMDLGKLVYPELPASLAFYNSLYTMMPYFKDEGNQFDPRKTRKDQLYHYNAKDCISTHQVYSGLRKDAKELGVEPFFKERIRPMWHFYRRIDDVGIRVDSLVRKKLISKYESLFLVHKTNLQSILGSEFNPLSPKQCNELIYDEFKLPVRKKRNALGVLTPTTDNLALKWHLLNCELPDDIYNIINDILCSRHYNKYLDYITAIAHPDGTLKTHFKPSGTDSGRTSTNFHLDQWYFLNANKNIQYKDMGLPFHNFPKHGFELPSGFSDGKDLRSMLVPRKGNVFFSYDQSGAEARVVAVIAMDEDLQAILRDGDVHRWTASLVLEISEDAITKEQREKKGKRVRHGGHYDMAAPKLAEIAQLPDSEARQALKKFHEKSPKIRGIFQASIEEEIRNRGCLWSPYGRRRDFFGRLDNASVHRVGYSYLPQTIVSDKQKFGMMELEKRPEWEKAGAMWELEQHDGCLGECKEGEQGYIFEAANEIMSRQTLMNKGSIIRKQPIEIPIECEWSDTNWGEMKEWKA